jgi:chemotaxis signal transduction protein
MMNDTGIEHSALAEQAESGKDRSELRHGFQISGRNFLIGYQDAAALTEMQPIFRLPNTPSWFPGLANLQGVVTPVFDMATYLGLAHASGQKQMLMTVGRGAQAAAVIVDGTTQLIDLSHAQNIDSIEVGDGLRDVVSTVWVHNQQGWYDLRIFDWLRLVSEKIPR